MNMLYFFAKLVKPMRDETATTFLRVPLRMRGMKAEIAWIVPKAFVLKVLSAASSKKAGLDWTLRVSLVRLNVLTFGHGSKRTLC